MKYENKTSLTKKERKKLKKEAKEVERIQRAQAKKNKKYFVRALILFFAFLTIFTFWKLSQQQNKEPALSKDSILELKVNDWTKGNPDASVVIVEYLDFECEACRAYYPLVKRLVEEYKNEILLISRYFPLSGHKNAMTSALAIEAAGRQGKYWEMHDLLFENQREWGEQKFPNKDIFEKYAKQLNLDMEIFKKDVDSKELKSRVLEDKSQGIEIGVNGTPTFFLNGKKIKNPRGYEAFKSLIDEALK